MNSLRNGVAWLQTVRKASMSDLATYTRTGFPPLNNLAVTPAETNFAVDDGDSVRLASKQQDWVVTAGDLVINGSVTLPLKGDRLTITLGGIAGVFEVQVPDSSDMPYKLDQTGLQLRIHTKRISS